MCLALKALHVQEERDRLRLDFNELEERVNPNFVFFLSLFLYLLCGVANTTGFIFQSACTITPTGIPPLLLMCACMCTRLCTSVCARVYAWSTWGTPAETAVLCGCVRCHPLTNNLLMFYCVVFHASHSNGRHEGKTLCFWNDSKKEWFLCWTSEYNIYSVSLICNYWTLVTFSF